MSSYATARCSKDRDHGLFPWTLLSTKVLLHKIDTDTRLRSDNRVKMGPSKDFSRIMIGRHFSSVSGHVVQ